MDYKLCILTAGRGTRNKYAQDTNKALLPLGDGTALSYIIDKFPPEIEIVIAVGYNADLVASYALTNWYRRIIYKKVNYEGKHKGPGYSLFQCASFLQCPFVYIACDTIVIGDIPKPDRNWIGVSEVRENRSYLTMRVHSHFVNQIYDKEDKNATYLASIGLVGVKDYKDFWAGLANPTIVQGEHQDTSGIRALIPKKLRPIYFNWFDTGTTEGYENTKRRFDKSISR